jgi:hypothetical protein
MGHYFVQSGERTLCENGLSSKINTMENFGFLQRTKLSNMDGAVIQSSRGVFVE